MWIYPANEGKSHERENDTVVVGARRIDVQRMTGKACCGCSMWVRSCLQRPNSITLSRWKTGRRSDRKPGFRQVRAGLPPARDKLETSSRLFGYQIPLCYPLADQVSDLDAHLRVRVVCMSQAKLLRSTSPRSQCADK